MAECSALSQVSSRPSCASDFLHGFTDSERQEIAPAGEASVQLVRRNAGSVTVTELALEPCDLVDGHSLSLPGLNETKLIARFDDKAGDAAFDPHC